VPIDKKRALGDFIETSSFQLDDFYIDNHSYQTTCSCGNGTYSQRYFLYVMGIWNYKGGGHLQMKTTPKENNRNAIDEIFIEQSKSTNSK